MADETAVGVSEWIDKDFGGLDLRDRPEPIGSRRPEQNLAELDAEDKTEEPAAEPVQKTDEPQVEKIDLGDGGFVEITKTSKGYEAVLETGTGSGREVFKGRTKNELFQTLAVAKLNASRKIRDLNRKLVVGDGDVPAIPKPAVAEPIREAAASGRFTDAEIQQFNVEFKQRPIATLEKLQSIWFQRQLGMTVEEARARLHEGSEAQAQLRAEQESAKFLQQHADYFACPENLRLLQQFLAKHEMPWTAENLGIAYARLNRDGLLETKPAEARPEPAAVPPAAEPAPSTGRIVRETVRPQLPGSYGVRPGDTTPVPAPSGAANDEDLSKLSTEELKRLMDESLREAARQRRR